MQLQPDLHPSKRSRRLTSSLDLPGQTSAITTASTPGPARCPAAGTWSACVPPGSRGTNAKWTSVSDATERPASLTRTREMWSASKYLFTLFVLRPFVFVGERPLRARSASRMSPPLILADRTAHMFHTTERHFFPGEAYLPACDQHPLFLHPSAAQMAELHQAVSCVMDIATMEEPVTWTPTPTYPSVSKSLLNG